MMPDPYDRIDRGVRRVRGRLRAFDASLPGWVKFALCVALGALALPWVLRAYAWYWGAAWGPLEGLLDMLPRVP
mgnify:CR=1 FL=1